MTSYNLASKILLETMKPTDSKSSRVRILEIVIGGLTEHQLEEIRGVLLGMCKENLEKAE